MPFTASYRTFSDAVERLRSVSETPDSLLLQLVGNLTANLAETEKGILRDYGYISAGAIVFLLLDSGMIKQVPWLGMSISRTGILMAIIPLGTAFFYYQLVLRIMFAHDIRTLLSLFYKSYKPPVYTHLIDPLTHFPSFRNLEMYISRYHREDSLRRIAQITTTVVVVALSILPLIVTIVELWRLFSYLKLLPWLLVTLSCVLLLARALMIGGLRTHDTEPFSERRGEESGEPAA